MTFVTIKCYLTYEPSEVFLAGFTCYFPFPAPGSLTELVFLGGLSCAALCDKDPSLRAKQPYLDLGDCE